MNKKNCRDALDLYKKFLIRMDRVGEFLKVTIKTSNILLHIHYISYYYNINENVCEEFGPNG